MAVSRTEASIERAVVAYAKKTRGVLAIKLGTGSRFASTGWPDRLFVGRSAVLFMEFKRPGGKLTSLQAERCRQLRHLGWTVHVVSDVEAGKSLIYSIGDGT
jgi:hypothetical protein